MEASLLTTVFLPIAVVIIMFGLGMTLSTADFARIARYPRAVALGLTFQLAVLPVVAYLVVQAFGLGPALGMGLMILALSPAGATSNMMTFLSKGDLALAVTLTALSSVMTPFTLPIVAQFFMARLMGDATTIALPVGETIVNLMALTVVPIIIGMLVARFAAGFAARAERPFKIMSFAFLIIVIIGVLLQNGAKVPGFFAAVGLPALALNVAALALGYFGAKIARLERRQAITLGIEVGVHNATMALFVTGTVLKSPEMSIAPAIYSLIMFATAGAYGYLLNRGGPQPEAAK